MDDSLKKKLREDLEYYGVGGDPQKDKFQVGVKEGEYEVAEDKRTSQIRSGINAAMEHLITSNVDNFGGDREKAKWTIVAIFEAMFIR